MAFKRDNLVVTSGNYKAGVVPAVYTYWNEANDIMTTADFMDDIALKVGDQIWVIANDYTAQVLYNVASVANGAATLQASVTPL